jgi:hypothetical protein
MMGHAKPKTIAVYMHRVSAAQMAAQGKYLEAIIVMPMVNRGNLGLVGGLGEAAQFAKLFIRFGGPDRDLSP